MGEAKIEVIKALWREEIDEWVLKAAIEYLHEYPPEIQTIIQEEAVRRGLLEGSDIEPALSAVVDKFDVNEVSFKAHSSDRKGYFCPQCKDEVYLKPLTILCSKCHNSLERSGYCEECDRFWAMLPNGLCPIDKTELVRTKLSSAEKLGWLLMSGFVHLLGFIVSEFFSLLLS